MSKRLVHIRTKAVQLRRSKHLTLDQISQRLGVSRTTVFYWIKNVKIPAAKLLRIRRRSLKRGALNNKKKHAKLRADAYTQGRTEAESALKNQLNRDFAVMYLCEGCRRGRWVIGVSNSNPTVIALAQEWMKKHTPKALDYVLQIHDDIKPETAIRHWTKRLGINKNRIKVIIKSNSGRLSGRVWRCLHGVMHIRYNDTYMKCRLDAWMDHIQAKW